MSQGLDAFLTALGAVLAGLSPPAVALIQAHSSRRQETPTGQAGKPEQPRKDEHRPWMVPTAMGAWIIAIALAFVLIISGLAANTPIMSTSLVAKSRVVIGLIALVAVSSGATGIAVTLHHSPRQHRHDIVRGACYVIGGLCVIAGIAVIA
jgi:hypothetical protein